MRIAYLKISNILGHEDLEVTPGRYNEISGANGTGKTSVIEAIKAALKTGTDASLLRNGAEKAEIVILFDNGRKLSRKFNPTGSSSLSYIDPEGRPILKPQTDLDGLYDLTQINPLSFLSADKNDRAKILLDSIPLRLPFDEIETLLTELGFKMDLTGNPIRVIDKAQKQIFDERTIQNRLLKEKETTKDALIRTLPPVTVSNPDAMITEIETKLSYWETRFHEDTNSIHELKTAALLELQERYNDEIRQTEEKYNNLLNDKNQKYQDAIAAKNSELQELRSVKESAIRSQNIRDSINTFSAEAKIYEERSKSLTKAIDSLKAIKQGMLKDLPISGLEVIEGEVYRNGVSLDRLNTAQQIEIAVDIAKLRAGELGIICVDGIERFDSEALNLFQNKMIESGLQAFVTRVTDNEFQINQQ